VEIDGFAAPFWMGADADDAFDFVAGIGIVQGLLHGLAVSEQRAALANLRATIEAHDGADGVVFASAPWIIRAVR
jgi:hypothetical protein